MLALLAILVLAPLLYLPGFLLSRAWLGSAQPPDRLARHFERVLAGALLNGWLALTLAELGVFSAIVHLVVLALVCAAFALAAWRRGALQQLRQQQKDLRSRELRGEALLFGAVLLLFVLLVARPFEVVLGARDAGVYASTGFAIARSGGILQHDALVQQIAADEASSDLILSAAAAQARTNLLGSQPASRYLATRLRFAGFLINDGDLASGTVTPQFFHLYPAWIALLSSLLGLRGGLLATSLCGFLGVWGVGMLGRRLAGPWVGLLGMLFLGLNGAQVWFSRYSTSEACAQFLSFAALYGFAAMQRHDEDDAGAHQSFAGLLAGVAAGQLALTRIDFFPIVIPFLAYIGYMALLRRWSRPTSALALGLGAMLLQAVAHILTISRAYFFDLIYARLQDQSALAAALAWPFLTPGLRNTFMTIPRSEALRASYRLPVEVIVVLVLLAAFVLLRRDGRPQRWLEQSALRWRRWLVGFGALAVLLLGVYGYLIRPQILNARVLAALPGCLATPASAPCLAAQGYVGAPIASATHPNMVAYTLSSVPNLLRGRSVPPRAEAEFVPGRPGDSEKAGIAQANLVRVGWYLSPLGMLLALAGAALWWWRGMNRASWVFLVASLASTFFFVRLSYGTTDLTYIYILRRYIPLAYPALSLCAAYALVALAGWKKQSASSPDQAGSRFLARGPQFFRVGVAALLALAQIAFFVVTNRQLYQHVEYAGALDQLAAIASEFKPGDVVLFRGEGRDTPDLVATPLKYAYGLDTFAIRSTDPGPYAAQLADYVRRWQAQGRQVYLVLGANGGVALPGWQPVRVGSATLHLPEFQQLRDQKPSVPLEFTFDFTTYRLDPPSSAPPTTTVAVDDFTSQLRGFFHPEAINGVMAAWTDGDAVLRLPWPSAGQQLALTIDLAAGASRPATLGPARACLSFQPAADFAAPSTPFQNEQCFELGAEMRSYTYSVDITSITAPPTGTFLLRIASPTWVPANADPAQHDQRSLGVQFGGLRIP